MWGPVVGDMAVGDAGMRDFWTALKVVAAVAIVAAAAGACAPSSLTEIRNVNLIPRVSNIARPDWLTYSGAKSEFTLRPVTAADLVSAEGHCAMAAAEAQAAPDPAADGGSQ